MTKALELFKVKRTECRMMILRKYDITKSKVYIGNYNWADMDLSFFVNNSFDEFSNRVQEGYFTTRIGFSSIHTNGIENVVVLYPDAPPGKAVSTTGYEIIASYIVSDIYKHFIIIAENGLDAKHSGMIRNEVIGKEIELFQDKRTCHTSIRACIRSYLGQIQD